ncbi:hypothetical protein EES40_09830 [Streptomyces sp. ADI93-02]|nr:hypothetical protein EES40_09830 [Streptomyces sp. ADI93-02]
MYGLIQTQIFRPLFLSRAIMPSGSGKTAGSHSKSHHWYSRIQKQSKWKTLSGIPRSAMPSTKEVTVASSYDVVKDVVSQRPNDHAGGRAGRPVRAA